MQYSACNERGLYEFNKTAAEILVSYKKTLSSPIP